MGGAPAPDGTLQWIFSDGLAAVSLFVEAYDRQRHVQEGLFSSGATQTLTRRIQDWWLTAVGEVPPQTLKAFAQSLERRK
jgi:sigma-E factor negative regulatory protein RseB